MTRRLTAIAIAAVTVLAASACGGGGADAGGAAAEKTVVVGADLPLQGPKKAAHEETVNALKLYLEQVGGKAGKYKVELKIYDNSTAAKGSYDVETCKKNAAEHVANAAEVAVLGPVNSPCTMQIIPILNADPTGPMLQVSHANTTTGLTRPSEPGEPDKYYPSGKRNFGRTVTYDDVQGVAANQFAAKELGVKKCFIANDGTAYGKGVAKVFAAEAAKQGVEVAGNESWDVKQFTYTTMFTAAKAANPDCVYLAGVVDNNGIQVVKDKVKVLGDNTAVKLLATQGFSGSKDLQATAEAQDMYTSFAAHAVAHVRKQNGPGAKFLEAYKAKYGTDAISTYVVTGVQALQIILKAIEMSDGTRKGVRNAAFDGTGATVPAATAIVGKDVTLDPKTGDINVHDVSMFQTKANKEEFLKVWSVS